MNKTIIINIGNAIVHIEEEAYEILMVYLNEIKQHFAKSADDFEIVKDIENRIAEMFAEILQKNQKQVIDVADVQGVIAQMGSVKDFLADEEEARSEYPEANYIGAKKLFRDTEGGVIAGVGAGLAHYMNIEKHWIRVAFFLSIFLGGAGILAYFILWMAIPKAKNRSERMEMKGEATNLYGFKRSFDEEVEMIKRNMQSANKEIQPMVTSLADVIAQIFKGLGKVFGFLGKLVGKAFAWFIIIIGFCFLVSFIVMLGLLLGAWDGGLYENFPFNIFNVTYRDEFAFAAFLTAFIPVLALVLLALKVVFNRIQINKYVSFLMLGIWIIAAVTTSANVAKVLSAFNEEAEIVKTVDLKKYPRFVINVEQTMVFTREDSVKYNLGVSTSEFKVLADRNNNGPFVDPKNVRLEFEQAEGVNGNITQSFKSNGKNFQDALQNAQNLSYKYQVRDSVINLTPKAILKKAAAWRDQQVILTVKLPVGTEVLLDHNLYQYLDFYYYCDHGDQPRDNENEVWVMTVDGLKCKYELEHPRTEN